jgi:large subunit ribosomal protein L11
MSGKRIARYIRATVPAQEASMSTLGAQLGQHGFKVIDFCQSFNKETTGYAKGVAIPVNITLYGDRTFSYELSSPSVTYLLKKAAGTSKEVTTRELLAIAAIKDGSAAQGIPEEADHLAPIARSLVGTCASMGFRVVHEPVEAETATDGATGS